MVLPGLQVNSQLVLLVLVDVLIELVQLLLLPQPDLLLALLLRGDAAAPPPGAAEGAAGPGGILNKDLYSLIISLSEMENKMEWNIILFSIILS